MKILIGTPVHEVKNYCMERWLENVSNLEYPADLFMVDNSIGTDYVEKIKDYCTKHGITNYQLVHLELPPKQLVDERVARCREIIRQEILTNAYDAWFTWECDQLIPTNALNELIRLMNSGNFMMVNHNAWERKTDKPNTDFGCSLIKRECLEKYSFLLEFGTDSDMPDSWGKSEAWLKKRVLRGGGNYIEVYGIVQPIYHLDS